MLLKLKVRPEHTDGLRGYVVRAGGRVLDPALDGFIVELTASEAEINTFIRELSSRAELLEVARSGALGMGRSARPMQLVKSGGWTGVSRPRVLIVGHPGEPLPSYRSVPGATDAEVILAESSAGTLEPLLQEDYAVILLQSRGARR